VPDVTERMNYFDRQFLRAEDFLDEQAYHLDRRRRHNAGFHAPGVVEGLVVAGDPATALTVSQGWAVDTEGREIVLVTPLSNIPTGGVDVDVWIAYPEPEPKSPPVTEAGTTGSARVVETPVVSVLPPGTVPAKALRLARVAGGAIDNSVRRLAGLKDLAVVGPNLADDAVSSRALAEADPTPGQDTATGTGVKTNHLKNGAVTEAKLANGAVAEAKLANGAVTEGKLANGAVAEAKLANVAVTEAKLANGAVAEAKLANGAVSAAKLRSHPSDSAQRAVGREHVQVNTVSITQLQASLVLGSEFSVPAAPAAGQVGELAITMDLTDGPSFFLVSVHYVAPRPAAGETVNRSFTWTRRTTVSKPTPAAGLLHIHTVLVQNPNPVPISVGVRAFRLSE